MKLILFICLMVMSSASVAATPYIKAHVSAFDDECTDNCNLTHELVSAPFGASAGVYFGTKYIAGAEVSQIGADGSASLYVGRKFNDLSVVIGRGYGEADIDDPNYIDERVYSESANTTFNFIEASYKWMFMRYTLADVQSEYSYKDKVGTDVNNDPIYGSNTTEKKTFERGSVTLGVRVDF